MIKILAESILNYKLWFAWAWNDILQRYRRSILGPFWITISSATVILCLGFIYSSMLNVPLENYIPWLGVGLILWYFFSSIIIEGTNLFTEHEGLMKEIRINYLIFIFRVLIRNVIILFHNMIIIACIILYFDIGLNFNILLFIPGIILCSISAFAVIGICGIICARYRDVSHIITNFTQLLFFLTPIIWKPNLIEGRKLLIVDFNPLFYFLNIVRNPLINLEVGLISWVVSLIITILLIVIFFIFFYLYRKKIVFWL